MGPSTILLSALLGWSHVAPSPAPAHGMVHIPTYYNNSMLNNYPAVYPQLQTAYNYPIAYNFPQTVNISALGGFFYNYLPSFKSLHGTNLTETANIKDQRTTEARSIGCQAGWSAFNGKCYKFFSEKKTWEDAEDQCVEEQVGR